MDEARPASPEMPALDATAANTTARVEHPGESAQRLPQDAQAQQEQEAAEFEAKYVGSSLHGLRAALAGITSQRKELQDEIVADMRRRGEVLVVPKRSGEKLSLRIEELARSPSGGRSHFSVRGGNKMDHAEIVSIPEGRDAGLDALAREEAWLVGRIQEQGSTTRR